ncbi:MAG TPA: RNA polymerase sigma factor [Pseudonocardiaceae bacterium]|nr:RNA polymerase sigma factor [Pseudonocardiaceae bacterium]
MLRHTVARSDAQLWRLIALDDHPAFAELFERHAKAVWNYAYRLTASWAAADDLLAETFLVAWRRRGEVRLVRDSALPWLYTVANNLGRDERGRKRRFLRLLPQLAGEDSEPDHAEAIAEDSASRSRLAEVVAAIGRLPKGEREAVRVCLLGGVSTSDAAALFGISEVSVRSRLSRARARLHTILEEHGDA